MIRRFKRKAAMVHAIQWDAAKETAEYLRAWSDHRIRHYGGTVCFVETQNGTQEAHKGDWIVGAEVGGFYVLTPGEFTYFYEPLE